MHHRFRLLFHGLLAVLLLLSCTQTGLTPDAVAPPAAASLQPTDFKLLQLQPESAADPQRSTAFQAHFRDHTGSHEATGVLQQTPRAQDADKAEKPFGTQTINHVEGLVTTVGSRHGTQTLHYRVQLERRSGLLQPTWLHFAFQGPRNSASCFNTNGYVYRSIQMPASGTLQLDITLTLPYWFIQNGDYDVQISEHHDSYKPANPEASQLSLYEAPPFKVDNQQNFTLTGIQTTADVSQGQALSIAIDYTSGDAFDGYLAGPLGAEAPMDAAFANCGRDIAGFNWAPPANLAPGTYEIYLKLIDFPNVTSNRLPITILNPHYVDPNPTPTPEPSATPTPEPSEPPGEDDDEACTCGSDGFSVLNNKKCTPSKTQICHAIHKSPLPLKDKNGKNTKTCPMVPSAGADSVYSLINVFDFQRNELPTYPNTKDITLVFKQSNASALNLNYVPNEMQDSQSKLKEDIFFNNHVQVLGSVAGGTQAQDILLKTPALHHMAISNPEYQKTFYSDGMTDLWQGVGSVSRLRGSIIDVTTQNTQVSPGIVFRSPIDKKNYWSGEQVIVVSANIRALESQGQVVTLDVRFKHPSKNQSNSLKLRLTPGKNNQTNWSEAQCVD